MGLMVSGEMHGSDFESVSWLYLQDLYRKKQDRSVVQVDRNYKWQAFVPATLQTQCTYYSTVFIFFSRQVVPNC